MPTPIIELQRRLTLVGEIRIGGEKQPRRPGAKLEAFRLTSQTRSLVEQAAKLYGGEITSWASPNGDAWQVYTEAAEMPVLVMPSYSLTQRYELWEGATQRLRTCDGYTDDISGGPCICNAEGVERCDIYTRLVVALPELDTVLGWRIITRGANAAHELPTMLALIERVSNGATFVPAKLRIDQRRGVKDGQLVRYIVPTLDLGLSFSSFAGAAEGKMLPSASQPPPETLSYEPVAGKTFAIATALDSVSEPLKREREPSGATAPLGAVTAPPLADATPIPTPESETFVAPDVKSDAQTKKASDAQKKKLNVLVGKLREGGHIETRALYTSIATRLRSTTTRELIDELGGRDDAGDIHWSPLRDSLTRVEANTLIDWLERKQTSLQEVTP